MTQSTFVESLSWELRLHGHTVDRPELEAFVASAWPLIEDDGGNVGRWVAEYLECCQMPVGV